MRDYWQKTKHPNMPDDQLVKLSQRLTLILAHLVRHRHGHPRLQRGRGCVLDHNLRLVGHRRDVLPVVILSLFWSKLTSLGAKLGMVSGFLCVPFFKFAAPAIL